MVGVIEEMDPATGQLKRYELDAKKENKLKGYTEDFDKQLKPPKAVV